MSRKNNMSKGDTQETKIIPQVDAQNKEKTDTDFSKRAVPNGNESKKGVPNNSYVDKDSIDTSNKAMFESINSYKKTEMTVNEYWERIFYAHLKTKELYILAEEYGSELQTFYLPINSMKNAYEHVIHVCANDYMARTGNSSNNEKYVSDNLRKALGYECKAFFDTADFLSILLRKRIAERLSTFTYPQIASVWDEYNTVRLQLIQVNQEIADIRNRKTDNNDYYIDEDIEKYYMETKNLLDWYIFIEEKVYPKLEQRFGDI